MLELVMLLLRRAVRASLSIARGTGDGQGAFATRAVNGYGGVPAMDGVGLHCELIVTCRGEPDARTGYFKDIKVIDDAVRGAVLPGLSTSIIDRPRTHPATLLAQFMDALDARLGRGSLVSVRWNLTPTYNVEVFMATASSSAPAFLLRQRFEIAAAHRLHSASLSDQENVATFGKCNRPSGHGHNYVIEVCVRAEFCDSPITLTTLETLVHRTILEPFDHTFLNIDTPAFDQRLGGVNPSVENIARVFYERLAPEVLAAGHARLESMTVFETEKTSATYPA
jgi:6-pyruvoyltetrahydropterin/6-carboxytetrahydropterin synthase